MNRHDPFESHCLSVEFERRQMGLIEGGYEMDRYDALEMKHLTTVVEYMQRDMRTIAKELHELNKKLDVYLGFMSDREFYEYAQTHGIPVCNKLRDALNKEEKLK